MFSCIEALLISLGGGAVFHSSLQRIGTISDNQRSKARPKMPTFHRVLVPR